MRDHSDIELSPDGQAGQKPKVGNHIIDWVRSPNFISRYATCVCYQCKRHVTCETVNKSFWQNRAENWESRVTFFLPVKRAETFKDKTHTAGDGICRHLFFLCFFMDKRDGEYEEAEKWTWKHKSVRLFMRR